MQLSNDQTISDPEFLDRLFDRAVAALEEGNTLDLGAELEERRHLGSEVEELCQLAERLAIGGPRSAPPEIPGYTVLAELGRGGMGVVYLARQERAGGRMVALKVVPSAAVQSRRALERFASEANSIAGLRHTNIVSVHDVITEGGVYAYAMEWVRGVSLGKLISELRLLDDEPTVNDFVRVVSPQSKRIPNGTYPVLICEIGIKIARALAAVHEQGMVHRDVKPSNILLRNDGTPMLADFGLVRGPDNPGLTRTGQIVGTPLYAAPEQLRGEPDAIDARSDIYALGVTLYHALALRTPYASSSAVVLLSQIESGTGTPLRKANPSLSTDLQTIVSKAMSANPAGRYQTADELADDLERLLSLRPIRARRVGFVGKLFKLAQRNRRNLIATVLGGVLGLAVAGVVTAQLFLVPNWIDSHVAAAHQELLDPVQTNRMFNFVYYGWEVESDALLGRGDTSNLVGSVRSLSDALRLRPWDDHMRDSRDTLRSCLLLRGTGTVAISTEYTGRFPSAAAYMEEAGQTGLYPGLDSGQLGGASAGDLYQLGLAALALNDPDSVLDAWSEFAERAEPDPLVEGALGYAYLITGRPALAYPRLRAAHEAYPEVGFICAYLADAAIRVGDLGAARQILDRAKGLEKHERQGTMLRIEHDYLIASGDYDAAERFWDTNERNGFGGNPLAFEARAEMFAQAGHPRDAIGTLALQYVSDPNGPNNGIYIARSFLLSIVSYGDAWWEGVSEAERIGLLQHPDDAEVSFADIALVYRVAVDRLSARFGLEVGEATGAGPEEIGRWTLLDASIYLDSG